jgi:hypothetical protein
MTESWNRARMMNRLIEDMRIGESVNPKDRSFIVEPNDLTFLRQWKRNYHFILSQVDTNQEFTNY